MIHYLKSFAILLITFMVYSTSGNKLNFLCQRTCGSTSLQYPFGFSEGCQVKLTCGGGGGGHVQVGEFGVQRVTPNSIFVNIPAKCDRSISSIAQLFGHNYAPTTNNNLLVQNCTSISSGCVVPPRFVGDRVEIEGCDARNDNISCFSQELVNKTSNLLSYRDVDEAKCKYFFSAIAVDDSNISSETGVSLEFQVLELGWWLPGSCACSSNANCTPVRLHHNRSGYRCQCLQGYRGDGFLNGTGCRRASDCNASKYMAGECGGTTRIGVLVGGLIAGATSMAGLSFLCCFLRRRSTCLRNRMSARRLLCEAAGNTSVALYPYKDIEKATNRFSEKQRLGTGAFGTVYAGKLNNDDCVAIKKIKHRDPNSFNLVMNEIKLLSSVSHPNLVRLLGCSIEEGEQILVYEYMPNGTLSEHLQRKRGEGLPWTVRLTIAAETAHAIAYLHTAMNPPIYHRDIKSSNILLDYNFKSKVADFGLSRLGMTELSHVSTAPQGTPGYVDPQYHQNFHLSDKSDVYSFGVVLVEIITALKVVDFERAQSEINLAALAIDRIKRGCIDEIIDKFLEPHRDAWTLYSIHKVSELAFRCLAFHSDMRPSMVEVAEELDHIRGSGWTAIEENICMASSIGSPCSSLRNSSEKSLRSKTFKRGGVDNQRLFVPHKVDSFLRSMEEVKDSSPVSVQDPWMSGNSSPSTSSLLSNAVQ